MANSWEPMYPWGTPKDVPLNEQTSTTGAVEWVIAPPTSHVSRFRFWDAREHAVIRKFGRFAGKSQLHVIFKGPKGVGEGPEYWYFFSDHLAGLDIADRMAASPHPYGQVLYPLVILGGVEYQRQSK